MLSITMMMKLQINNNNVSLHSIYSYQISPQTSVKQIYVILCNLCSILKHTLYFYLKDTKINDIKYNFNLIQFYTCSKYNSTNLGVDIYYLFINRVHTRQSCP